MKNRISIVVMMKQLTKLLVTLSERAQDFDNGKSNGPLHYGTNTKSSKYESTRVLELLRWVRVILDHWLWSFQRNGPWDCLDSTRRFLQYPVEFKLGWNSFFSLTFFRHSFHDCYVVYWLRWLFVPSHPYYITCILDLELIFHDIDPSAGLWKK